MANVSKISIGNQSFNIQDANLAKTALQFDSENDVGQNVIESVLINGQRYILGGNGGGAGITRALSVEFPINNDDGRIADIDSQLPEGLYFVDVCFNNIATGMPECNPSYGTTIYIRNNNIRGDDNGSDDNNFPIMRSALFGTTSSSSSTASFEMLYIQYILSNKGNENALVEECSPIISLRYSNGNVCRCDFETNITANFYKLN